MSSETVKGNMRRLYLTDEDLQKLAEISDATNLGQTEILSQVVHAGLAAWLELGGRLPITQSNNRLAALAASAVASGVPWPANVTRHSWCSYHLARGGSAAQTALLAGHTESMLFRHYRELVTQSQAGAFFGLRPG